MKKHTHIESAGVSDVGMQRECNEDALASSDALGLYAVADGMGGHMHGDVASKTTIETLLREVTRYHEGEEKGEEQQACYDAISHAITECNNSILRKNHDNDSKVGEGMGTTLVGAYFLKNSLHVLTFNVGDSRIYRLRDDSFEQITRDQTMYQEWVEAGQKGLVPSQNILINAIGLVENLAAEIKLENVILGDVLLICSDGLSGLVDDQALKRFLRENAMLSVGEMCSQLVQVANKNGGHDNITVIIVRIGGPTFLEPVKNSNSHATMPRIKSV